MDALISGDRAGEGVKGIFLKATTSVGTGKLVVVDRGTDSVVGVASFPSSARQPQKSRA